MSHYSIDLRVDEITLLRRALTIYSNTYRDLMCKAEKDWEKHELRTYSEAADALSHRLLKDVRRADIVGQEALTRIITEIAETASRAATTNPPNGWELVAEKLVESITKGSQVVFPEEVTGLVASSPQVVATPSEGG